MMDGFPKISIVTPSFNQAQFLERTLRSVLDQGYPNLEYIVIDGGSNDGSAALIERFADRLSYQVSERDRGQSDAINKGFARATGDILGWINSDDFLEPGSLHRIADYFADSSGPAWLVGSARLVDEQERELSVRAPATITPTTFLRWTADWFPQQATFWTRSMWEQAGPLDEHLHYTMDLALWQRMFQISPPQQVPDLLAGYRIHDSAKCVSDNAAARAEQRRLIHAWYARYRADRPPTGASVETSQEHATGLLDDLLDDYVALNEQLADTQARIARIKRHPVIGRLIRAWTRFVNPGFDV